MHRILTILSISLAISVAGSASAAAGQADPLTPELLEDAPGAVALFHPSNARSLQLLDQLAERSSGELLAVCVGAGCTAEIAVRTAHQRGWPFRLAYDPSGEISLAQLGVRAAGSVVAPDVAAPPAAEQAGTLDEGLAAVAPPALTQTIASPLSSARSAGVAAAAPAALRPTPRAMNNSLAGPGPLPAATVRDALFVAVPLVLVGFGGAALVFGARRRRRDDGDDATEAERIEQYVRAKHGRKAPPRRDP